MEMEDCPYIPFPNLLFVVSGAKERQRYPVRPQGRLNHVGDIAVFGFIVKVSQILPRGILMLGQVIVGAVSNPPQLAPAKGKQKFNVRGGLAVETQFLPKEVNQLMQNCFQ